MIWFLAALAVIVGWSWLDCRRIQRRRDQHRNETLAFKDDCERRGRPWR